MKPLSPLWLVSLMSVAPLYAAQVPTGTSLAAQQVFRYNNHSEPGTLDPQKIEENTAAQVAICLKGWYGWMAMAMATCSQLRSKAGKSARIANNASGEFYRLLSCISYIIFG